jgi:predicted MPP superfamily phosphohydrolase
MTLFLFSRLEKTIFNDDKCEKIFISEEDRSFYSMITGRFSDSAVWKVVPNMEIVNNNRFVVEKPTKIIWFGGIHAHKIDSVRWFITDVFYKLRQKYPHLEFHLYGNNTMAFDNPKNNIYAHGRYQGTSLPNKADSIYINPDVSGGGVKVKLIQYFEEGVTFVTSPFGMEGYSSELFDNKCRYCVQLDEWYTLLCGLFVHSFN